MTKRLALLCLPLLLCLPASAADLLQLLPPAGLTITLYPGQTRGQVRETSTLTLPAGETTVSFSWLAPGMEVSSVTLLVGGATVGEAVRAAGQDKIITWTVNAAQPVETQATVTYFLEGFKWYPTYQLWPQPDQKTARLVGTLHLTNQTGVDLGPAQLQVALGGPGSIGTADGEAGNPPTEARTVLTTAAPSSGLAEGATVDRQILAVPSVPAQLRYLYQADRFNGTVERLLQMQLPEGLGGLPDGAMTIYEPQDDSLPLFNTQLTYQPGQELKVGLGPEPEVVVERKLMNTTRTNFETDRFGRVTGSDTTEDYALSLRNRLAGPIALEWTETVLSTWDMKCALTPDKTDTSFVQFNLEVTPDQPLQAKYTLVKHSGSRAGKK